MRRIIFILITGFLLQTLPTLSSAGDTELETPLHIATRLQQRYNKIKSLTFTFHQDTRGEMTGRPRKGSGKAVFIRDENSNRMRWDYLQPDNQVLISDGKVFSMYFDKMHQMIVTPAENLDTELIYSFFTGRGNLVEDFHIVPPNDELKTTNVHGMNSIKLVPKKSQSQVQDIHLWVSEDSLLRRLHIRDHFGTITVLNFADISINSLTGKSVEQLDELFSFTPPEDTEIIYQ